MGTYSDIRDRLLKAATEHREMVQKLNASVFPFRTALAKSLDVVDSMMETGIGNTDVFEVRQSFAPDGLSNQITFSVAVTFQVGAGESIIATVPIVFRGNGRGIFVTVDDKEERDCGSVFGRTEDAGWLLVFADVADYLDRWSLHLAACLGN
jgi:hypothetical protein